MSTNFDADAIRTSATNLGKIMDDVSAFEALKPHWPNAGKFPLAQWVERIVDDRRNAVVAHAQHLKLALSDMSSTLTTIANDFDNADAENAQKIKSSIQHLEGQVTNDISTFDQNTEQQQHNFTDDTTQSNTNKPGDGDGYNDNLSTPISGGASNQPASQRPFYTSDPEPNSEYTPALPGRTYAPHNLQQPGEQQYDPTNFQQEQYAPLQPRQVMEPAQMQPAQPADPGLTPMEPRYQEQQPYPAQYQEQQPYPAQYQEQQAYPAQPAYQEQQPYPAQYQEQQPYPAQPAYQEQQAYPAQPAYQEQPVYAAEPRYQEQQAYPAQYQEQVQLNDPGEPRQQFEA
ncbi:hypothetical protein [Amycolatopsis pigmentata]|uniref:Uncharacterized protein n=1 Tax=Amycolatopsis pigmentata TaxID=450801 RepID=A0ABW5FX56_9PSEU